MTPPPAELRRAVTRSLLPWFARHKRDLPWRHNRTPYRVWISELMLQQTRVDTVIPYFERFLKRFPDVATLAGAPLGDVLKAWEGLGYYTRARNLHKAAQTITREHKGIFPETHDGLLALPGIGPYSAAAIASLAFGLDHAVLDGNVERVLARCLASDLPAGSPAARKGFQSVADALLPGGRAGEFNEAMMELGATVCTPRQPDCPACPLRRVCAAHAAGTPEQWPVRTAKKAVPTIRVAAAATRRKDGRILIARRLEKGLLGGMWEFPGGKIHSGETPRECVVRELEEELGITVEPGELLTRVKHTYSHFKLDMDVHWAVLKNGRPRAIECSDFAWARPDEMDDYAFSKADLMVIRALRESRA